MGRLRPEFLEDIRKLGDHELVSTAKKLSEKERELTTEILHYLMLIEDRRIYAKRAYSSLYDFAIQELKYSSGAAHRRISAMRLLREIPQTEPAIKSGKLSLSNASQVQDFFRLEKRENKRNYSSEEKNQIISKIEGLSRRECERELRAISPKAVPLERTRAISQTETTITFVADNELMKKLQDLKNLLSHKDPNPSYQKLFHMMADIASEKLKKKKQISSKQSPTSSMKATKSCASSIKISNSPARSHCGNKRAIPAAAKRRVWTRDQGRCQYKDSKTGRRCLSEHQVEFDHFKPVAFGGLSTEGNLRLLCATHNKLEAAHKLGERRMRAYWKIT